MSVVALKPQGYMLKSMTREQISETIGDFFKSPFMKDRGNADPADFRYPYGHLRI